MGLWYFGATRYNEDLDLLLYLLSVVNNGADDDDQENYQ